MSESDIQRAFREAREANDRKKQLAEQRKTTEYSAQVAHNISKIQNSLQQQILDNRINIKQNRVETEQNRKRANWQFWLSFSIAAVSAVIAFVSLIIQFV